MARNGAGTYSLPAGQPVVTGTTISSTTFNTLTADIATALTGSLAVNGEAVPTANLPMGGYKHTGVADATARNHYCSAGQSQDNTFDWLTSVSGTNTIIATGPIGLTAYAAGQVFRFVTAGANTGATTLNINGIGAKSITKLGTTSLASGDLISGAVYEVVYDGTQFQITANCINAYLALAGGTLTGLINQAAGANIASAATVDLTAATGNTVNITGTTPTSALTMNAGQQMWLIPTGAWPLTQNATTNNINGGASYTCAAGDRVFAVKDNAGIIQTTVFKADGTAVVSTISNAFESAETGLAASTPYSVPHGLASSPLLWKVVLRCKSAELGYSVNDEIPAINNNGGGITIPAGWVNATDIGFTTDSYLIASNKTTGVGSGITMASWKLVFRAWL